jgi:queuosine precursor transporter
VYLLAIVAANLLTARYGPVMSVFNAFMFIGLDLTCRDALHEEWSGAGLWPKMGALLAAGGLLSWLLNRDAGAIAAASMLAFSVAGLLDAFVYQRLHKRGLLLRVNGSNVVGAAADSFLFPLVAFGGLLWPVVVGQFLAKMAGGFVWSLVLVLVTTLPGRPTGSGPKRSNVWI